MSLYRTIMLVSTLLCVFFLMTGKILWVYGIALCSVLLLGPTLPTLIVVVATVLFVPSASSVAALYACATLVGISVLSLARSHISLFALEKY